ncbi:MAG: haloacid dehalogenase-like hydrolase [Bdellovibrionales bacterium]|nr:haloacid dehalogenase-like hydrolase [Bdellovibrionales bacterium]
MTPMPKAKLQKILDDLERHRPKGRAVAAFDADGTLWDTDLGEGLFSFQIENKLVPLPADPWGHYNYLKEHVSNPVAYLWLAQICKDVPLATVRAWAETSVASKPLPIFDEQLQIMEKLKQLQVEIYIVTASIKWAVEPGALRLGLTADDVIGIETEVVNGVVGDKQKGVITYREGKSEAILARTGGLAPYFTSGNTEGDKWLLEGATHLRLVMSAAPEGSENWPTESRMVALAKERDWHWHRFR